MRMYLNYENFRNGPASDRYIFSADDIVKNETHRFTPPIIQSIHRLWPGSLSRSCTQSTNFPFSPAAFFGLT